MVALPTCTTASMTAELMTLAGITSICELLLLLLLLLLWRWGCTIEGIRLATMVTSQIKDRAAPGRDHGRWTCNFGCGHDAPECLVGERQKQTVGSAVSSERG